jgi:hypothetical protein
MVRDDSGISTLAEAPPPAPYVVKYPWYMKLMALLSLGIVVFLLIPNPRTVVLELWETGNSVLRFCMLLCAVIIPAV